ncbi:MAG: phenylacetate-CoA oxygenase subunit PaaJ [Hamadaea sp.]|nr:phenylacetate-CoA oxygenase subunit PaaJ [Hamadaea sp.]
MVTLEAVVGGVVDPELRVVTIAELGVLRSVRVQPDQRVRVEITPTYAGCPAMDAIREDIRSALHEAGRDDVEIVTVLSPPWSTDMITESGRAALAKAGIAPPTGLLSIPPLCPRCGSGRTEEISRFGPTACQSIWRCLACLEPFDHVRKF